MRQVKARTPRSRIIQKRMGLLQTAADDTCGGGRLACDRLRQPAGDEGGRLLIWRNVVHRIPLSLGLEYWSMVFPLGMYAAATWALSNQKGAEFLAVIPRVCIWIALASWLFGFVGMIRHLLRLCRRGQRSLGMLTLKRVYEPAAPEDGLRSVAGRGGWIRRALRSIAGRSKSRPAPSCNGGSAGGEHDGLSSACGMRSSWVSIAKNWSA